MCLHCRFARGSVTLYGMNLNSENINLVFNDFKQSSVIHQYLMTPHGSEGLQAKYVVSHLIYFNKLSPFHLLI